jgi:DNA-binding LytR/AlgR family response regulator
MVDKWRVILVDDEPLARLGLRNCLTLRHPDFEIVGEAESMMQAWDIIRQDNKIDGVFLDIHIETESERAGLDFGFALNNLPNPPWVVFVTGLAEHALEAFDINPVGYLLKPLEQAKVDARLDWIRKNRPANKPVMTKNSFLKVKHKTVLANGEVLHGTAFVEPLDILYVHKNKGDNTVKVRLQGEILDGVSDTLMAWENRLSAQGFFKISKSDIVNLTHVLSTKSSQVGEGYKVCFKNITDELSVGLDYVDKLHSALQNR